MQNRQISVPNGWGAAQLLVPTARWVTMKPNHWRTRRRINDASAKSWNAGRDPHGHAIRLPQVVCVQANPQKVSEDRDLVKGLTDTIPAPHAIGLAGPANSRNSTIPWNLKPTLWLLQGSS